MNPRPFRRLVGQVSALALAAGTAAVLTATPAQAAEVPIKLEVSQPRPATQVYGATASFNGNMTRTDGSAARTNQPIYLQRRAAGSSTWKNVSSDPDGGGLWFDSQKFTGNAQYRAYFPGGPDRYDASIVYPAAYSNIAKTYTARAVSGKGYYLSGNRIRFRGAVKPKMSKKVKVQTRKRGKWVTVRKVKLAKRKKFNTVVRGRDGQKFRLFFPSDKKFVATKTRAFTIY